MNTKAEATTTTTPTGTTTTCRFQDWCATCLFVPYFIGVLVLFHPLHWLSKFIGKRATEITLVLMNDAFLWGLKVLAGTKVRIHMQDPVPLNTQLIIVSNHQSMFDITLIICFLKRGPIRFVAKKELAKWLPSISIALRNMQAALIDRKNQKQALKAIKNLAKIAHSTQTSVCIFPEGTRTRDGRLGQFKSSGLKTLMKEMPEAALCPLVISNSKQILDKGFWPITANVEIDLWVGAPFVPEDREDGIKRAKDFIEQHCGHSFRE